MPAANAQQLADWNGELGQRWVERQRELDRMLEPFSQALLDASAPQAGERVLDVGCGCGTTSLALAERVGASGRVLGIDISQPMLAVAREQGAAVKQLSYELADAASAALMADHDLLFSRFGLMFFDEPVGALLHLRGTLQPRGRVAFVCWRAPRDNSWAMTPLMAARKALGVEPPPSDPLAPGPFAFADGERLSGLLLQAGYGGIDLQRLDCPVRLGASAAEAAAHSLRAGPVSRFMREYGCGREAEVAAAVAQVLGPLAAADGSVNLNGSVWLVRAVR